MNDALDYLTTRVDQFRRNRLAALYSDFAHLRSTNPDGYTANIEAWRKGLADVAKEGHFPSRGSDTDLLVLNVNEDLLRSLETKEWGRPLAIGTVLRDAVRRKEMVPLREFMAAERSIYQKSWAVSPWALVSWGLERIGLVSTSFSEETPQTEKLVILSNVEAASKEITHRVDGQRARVERVYSKQLFCKAFAGVLASKVTMSQTDLDVLLKYMARERGMIAYDGKIVKFRALTEADPGNITSEDSTIASLKTLMQDLETQIETLSQRISTLRNTVQDALSRRNRVSALAALRLKKFTETNLSQQVAALGRLEEVYARIGQAEGQVELIRILDGSTGVLKALNAESGGVERVDDILEQVQEQMSQVEEIGNAIVETGQVGSVDEDDIESELEKMEANESEEKIDAERPKQDIKEREEAVATRQRLDTLGDVPQQVAVDVCGQPPVMDQSLEMAIAETAAKIRRMSLNPGPLGAEVIT